MPIIVHRVNTAEKLKKVPSHYGIEIDIRHDNRTGGLYLNHDPGTGEDLEEFLRSYHHAFVIFNIKEAGIEDRCRELAEKFKIAKENYFLLDVEFPYIYRASRQGVREIAIRYSEDEPIEAALKYQGKLDWVWIDTNTVLPLDAETVRKLKPFKTCLVCPERWGRPQDIENYIAKLEELNFTLDGVMTALEYTSLWEKSGRVSFG